jgi:hypothetical protein
MQDSTAVLICFAIILVAMMIWSCITPPKPKAPAVKIPDEENPPPPTIDSEGPYSEEMGVASHIEVLAPPPAYTADCMRGW